MIRNPRRTLPAVPAALVLLLVAEWLLPGAGAVPARLPPSLPSAATDAVANGDFVQWGTTILARPLLNPDRRPVRRPDIAESAGNYTLPRLSAIIVIGGVRSAIFAADGQKPQLVAEGGEIGTYRVKTVTPDRVDLLGPNGQITLRPQFNTPANATPAPATSD